jgi:hypothetical protein
MNADAYATAIAHVATVMASRATLFVPLLRSFITDGVGVALSTGFPSVGLSVSWSLAFLNRDG